MNESLQRHAFTDMMQNYPIYCYLFSTHGDSNASLSPHTGNTWVMIHNWPVSTTAKSTTDQYPLSNVPVQRYPLTKSWCGQSRVFKWEGQQPCALSHSLFLCWTMWFLSMSTVDNRSGSLLRNAHRVQQATLLSWTTVIRSADACRLNKGEPGKLVYKGWYNVVVNQPDLPASL